MFEIGAAADESLFSSGMFGPLTDDAQAAQGSSLHFRDDEISIKQEKTENPQTDKNNQDVSFLVVEVRFG